MGIISSEKIFVDPKEEINFVIDRALKSERERLIFVIPQNSIVLSSPVSINILYKEIAKTKKLGLIVTEDEYGTSIAQKAGFVVVPKVSQITGEEWENALSKKLSYISKQEKRKQELLSGIGLVGSEITENNKQEADTKNEELGMGNEGTGDKPQDTEYRLQNTDVEPETSNLEPDAPLQEVEPFEVEEEKHVVETEEPKAEFEVTEEELNETISENSSSKEEEEAENFLKKPRKESKVIEIGGIKLAAAGDIRTFLNSDQDDKIAGELSNQKMEDLPERKVKTIVGSSSFAGKDFTKKVKPAKGGNFFDNLFGGRSRLNPGDPTQAGLLQRERRKKLLMIGGVVGGILLLGGGYLFAFQLSSVDVSIKFKQEDVSGSANILINPDVTEVSFDPAVIPAKVLREENLSISKAGEASGTGKKGTKAKGFVTIYNLTENAITLESGKKLTNPSTQRVYILKQTVNLEAGSPSTAYYADNIPIEASDFGSEYNIPVSSDSTSLEIEGYPDEFASKKLYARVFNEVTGGASEEFVSVSKENFDTLKEKTLPEIESQGEARIRSSLPPGYTLISESMKFTESSVSSIPKVGEEAKDNSFTISIEGVMTAFAVSNDDLKKIAERVLSDNQNDELEEDDNLVVGEIELPQITKVEETENGTIITISTQASIGVRPSDESIKSSIAGKSVREAQDYLLEVDSIEDSRVSFTPSFIPEALRRVPSDLSRISIRIR